MEYYIIILIIMLILLMLYINETFTNDIKDNNTNNFVFIIIRHVNSKITNKYWIESYNCIRNHYPDTKIVIIDDNSDYYYINKEIKLINTEIIQSEYSKCGELLPYYYFYKNKYAKKAIIIHDSVFVNKYYDFNNIIITNVKFLWHCDMHNVDNNNKEKELIQHLNNNDELLELYNNKDKWHICFGVMSMINLEFLEKIENKYNFFNLLKHIKSRSDRMCLERIFGLICSAEHPYLIYNSSLFGHIHDNKWGYDFNEYNEDKQKNNLKNYFIKVWTGR